jgi:hypothetical protein
MGGLCAARHSQREIIMKVFIFVAAAIALSAGIVMAQSDGGGARPAIGMGSKTMESCRADTQKVCANATDYMRKECLVKNWDVISSDCQDALGKPFDGVSGRRGD